MIALLLAAVVATIAAPALPSALVAALLQDKEIAQCMSEAGTTAAAYVNRSFNVSHVMLRTGERMTVAEATDACLMRGQSTRIIIFARTGQGYRRVLDDVTMPERAQVSAEGTATLPTHETIETILESTYVWDGTAYRFSGPRSHVYDVSLGARRAYQTPVRFASGSFATILSGSTARNFGDDYIIEARSGQRLTVELLEHRGPAPSVALSTGEGAAALLAAGTSFSRTLPRTGTYELIVQGGDGSEGGTLSPYRYRLTIR